MGHDVTVQVVDSREIIETAVEAHRPDLVVCPMLKKLIPESVWRNYTCLVVHPGPHGDRGPSSLDWAIELGMEEWGVTILEAVEEADAGDIWETGRFRVRPVGKSSLYRHEVRRAGGPDAGQGGGQLRAWRVHAAAAAIMRTRRSPVGCVR